MTSAVKMGYFVGEPGAGGNYDGTACVDCGKQITKGHSRCQHCARKLRLKLDKMTRLRTLDEQMVAVLERIVEGR